MPKTNKIIVSLNAGELSPLMSSRFDQEKYGFGCRTQENFIPLIYGGAERRPGLEYITGCKSNSAKSRLVAFEHSVDDTYILEFANQVIRVFRSGAPVYVPYGTEDLSALSGSLVAHWKCDDNAASTAVDCDNDATHDGVASSNTNTITTTDAAGTANEAFDLGGTDHFTVGDHADFSFGDGSSDSPFSFAMWVYSIADGGNQTLASKYGGANQEWWFWMDGDEKINFWISDQNVSKTAKIITNDALSDGWHFIVVTYNGRGGATAADGFKIYVDWVEWETTATNDADYVAMEALGSDVEIGSYTGGSTEWEGKMDNVAIFNKALTDVEIAALTGADSTVVFEIESSYLTADLFELKFEHSADVMYITHPDYEPRKLSRLGHISWKLETLDIEDGPFRSQNDDTNATIAASAVTGSVTLTASGCNPFVDGTTAGHEPSGALATSKSQNGALFRLVQSPSTTYVSGLLDPTGANSSSTLTIYKGVTWDLVTNGTWGQAADSATIVLERSYDEGTTYETVVSFTSAANYNIKTSGTEENDDALYRLTVTETTAGGAACAFNLSIRDTGHIGVARITAVASTTSATATVLSTLGSTDATHRWSEGAWSNYRSWPVAVTISPEERLSFAGSPSKPLTVWGSVVGDFTSFKEGIIDDDAIIFTLVGSGKQNRIRWVVPKTALAIGTVGGEHILGASAEDEALTPTNVQAKLQTSYGSADIQALRVGQAILYVQRGKRKIREMIYDYESDSHKADDLTIFAHHITESGIVDMDFQRTPDPMLWCVRDDGEIAVLSYERDQNVFAWSRLVTTDSTADSDFESVAVIYGGAGEEDEVWVTVKRTIASATKRYVERFKTRNWGSDIEDAFFVDSGITYDSVTPASTVTAAHLKGETLAVWADGVAFDDAVANASTGVITLKLAGETTTASVIQYGLPYTPILIPMKLDLFNLGLATTKKITDVIVDLYKTMYGNIGTTEANVTPIVYRNAGDTTNVEFPLKTGYIKHSPRGGYNRDGDIVITQDKPAPMTILSLTFDIGVAGD